MSVVRGPSSRSNADGLVVRDRPRRAVVGLWLAATCCALATLGAGCRSPQRDALAKNLLDSRRLAMQGQDAAQRGNWDEARSCFDRAKSVCPENERARAGFAQSLWQQGRRPEAAAEMQEAVRLSGGDPELQVELGGMRLALGDVDGAHVCATSAIQAQWQNADAWALAGDIARVRGQSDESLRCYHRALACQPRMPRVQLAIASIYESQNRPLRALATLDAMLEEYAVEQAPCELLTRRGMALEQLGRYDDAIDSLTAAWKQDQAPPEVAAHLARCQSQLGRQASAILTVQDGLRRAPQNSELNALAGQFNVSDVRMAAREP